MSEDEDKEGEEGEKEKEKDAKMEKEDDEKDIDPLMDEILLDVDCLVQNDPRLDHTQTLEEILNESEILDLENSYREEPGGTPRKAYAIPPGGIDSDIGETLSVTSLGSRGTRSSQHNKDTGRGLGSIFRHVILKGVSAQMTSAADRVNTGHPTCMAATTMIGIGTQSGHVLVFDSNQVIKWFLAGTELREQYGAVSCLAFSVDSTRLLAGFARGQVIEYDMMTGKLLRDIQDVHPQGSAVVHLRYSEENHIAFLADSGGSVFELSLTRGIRGPTASCRCIFSGSRGEVCTMEPLRVSRQPDHPLAMFSILALATISKIIIITVKPRLKVLMTTALTGDAASLPLVCWQFVVIQNQFANKTSDPVLTFARGNKIHFYQISVNLSNKILFIPLQTIQLGYNLLSVSWMNSRCLGLLDQNEQFHLVDVRTKETLETVDLAKAEIVYQAQFFKGLANGGNVSAAFSLAGEMAVYGSNTVFTNQILVLGKKTFHALILRTWSERLDHLVKDNKFIEALQLGFEMFEDPGKSLVGLRGSTDRKRAHITLRLMGILKKFLDLSLTKNFPEEGGMATLTKYFNDIVPPCISICIKLNKAEFLFDRVWNTFQQDPFSCAVFLENLEPYILSDQLDVIPTSILQRFVDHYEKREKFQELEACITHLSVMCLDIHQIMLVCERHCLYDAIIYIHNNAILDYISPTEKMLKELSKAQETGDPLTQQQIDVGNKLLVYISCCLAGRAYPFGNIPQDRVKQVKYDIYSTITLLHSRTIKSEGSEPPYPHLHTLLFFNTQAFLNVLSIAFDEAEYRTELGKSQKQRLVDILLQVMVKDESPFSPTEIGFLFTFLARQISQGDSCLSISRDLFTSVLGVLAAPNESAHREEREDALLEMIGAGGRDLFNPGELQRACQAVGFYRVLKQIYLEQENYPKVLSCIIKDTLRRNQSFTFIKSVFTESKFSEENRKKVEQEILSSILDLLHTDVKKTGTVVFQFIPQTVPEVLEKVRGEPEYPEFLSNLLDLYELAEPGSPRKRMEDVFRVELFEEYIEILCQSSHQSALQYVKSKENYRSEVVMSLFEKYGNLEGRVYLLETENRFQDGFNLLQDQLENKIQSFVSQDDPDAELRIVEINTCLVVVIQFCQRVSGRLEEEERESLWTTLLDTLGKHLENMSNPEPWREMIRHVISSMLGHVGHKKVVSLVLSNPTSSSGKWSDLKQMLMELTETFRYEQQLMESGIEILEKERTDRLKRLVRLRTRAVYSESLNCPVCGDKLSSRVRSVVFTCRHGFHVECVDRCGGVTLSDSGEQVWTCSICNPSPGGQDTGKRVAVTGGGSANIVEDETLMKSVKSWSRFHQPTNYIQGIDTNHEQEGFMHTDKFALKLKPTRTNSAADS